ncbi:unnamed protein product, partial [Mesorhabditis spiculigera]
MDLRPMEIVNLTVIISSLLIFYFFQQILPEMSQPIRFPEVAVVDGASLVSFDKKPELKGLPWPSRGGRAVEGGDGDEFVKKKVAADLSKSDLIVHVDGPVFYQANNNEQFNIIIQRAKLELQEFIIPAKNGILIQPNVAHSAPFGNGGGCTQTVRATNGVLPAALYEMVEKPNFIQLKLDAGFSKEKLILEEATSNAAYEIVDQKDLDARSFRVANGRVVETVTPADWPLFLPNNEQHLASNVQALEQEFTMEWVDEGHRKEILFKGLSGSLAGGEGRPGVVYNKEKKTISINLLLSRPDGSFFISTNGELLMLIAQADHNGEPLRSTLEAVSFKNGVKLPAGWWHSVPFPRPDVAKIHLYEKVASTNANIVINVAEETGSPLTVQL